MADPDESPIERGRVLVTRACLVVITLLFMLGLILAGIGWPDRAMPLFLAGSILLVATPVIGIATALAEEIRRRDWLFAAAAGLVLLFVGFSFVVRLVWG